MKVSQWLATGVLMSTVMSSMTTMAATSASSFSAQQKADIEQIVHDYLLAKPEILVEMSKILQSKQVETQQMTAQKAIHEHATQLLSETMTVAGNPKGDVTLIEFFDYQCIHCKHSSPIIKKLIEKNPQLRVVYKEFPIFGKSSENASRVAIAAAMQGKYLKMQEAFLGSDKKLDDANLWAIAQTTGADVPRLKTDMNSQTVSGILKLNETLAEALHLMGTPAFLILQTPGGHFKNDSVAEFIPGGATEESLQALITKAAH